MQSPPHAIAELTRAVEELGLWGASIGTEFGIRLDAQELGPVYERCVALDVPLFMHPAPSGIDGPKGVPATDRYDLDILIGFAAQETLAVGTLIFGGVLDRHPELDICLSHGGGAIALLAGRFALAAQKRPWSLGAKARTWRVRDAVEAPVVRQSFTQRPGGGAARERRRARTAGARHEFCRVGCAFERIATARPVVVSRRQCPPLAAPVTLQCLRP